MKKTTEQKISEFVTWVNENFKAKNADHPVAVDRKQTITKHAIITGESVAFYPDSEFDFALPVCDYYGEHRGGYPWIHPLIEKKAEQMGLLLEWQNPAYLIICEA